MPTAITGQNGAEIHTSTPISVTGCSGSLSVTSHSVEKRTLSVSVYVPAAGKLRVSGKGLSSQTKKASGRETLTFTLKQKKAGKLKTKLEVTFTPSKGTPPGGTRSQTKTLSVKFKT